MLFITLLTLLPVVALGATQRGLAYIPKPAHPDDDQVWISAKSPLSWYYNWDSSPITAYNNKLEFVPMLWGKDQAPGFQAAVEKLSVKPTTLLFANEPDGTRNTGGSELSPAAAAALYKQYYQPFKAKGYRLGGPSTRGSPDGLKWATDFLAACDGCTIDFMPIHWYGNYAGLQWYLGQIKSKFPSYKIWVTEFANSDAKNSDDAASFLTQALALFDSYGVERVSYFPAVRAGESNLPSQCTLLTNTGDLSPVGKVYFDAPAAGPPSGPPAGPSSGPSAGPSGPATVPTPTGTKPAQTGPGSTPTATVPTLATSPSKTAGISSIPNPTASSGMTTTAKPPSATVAASPTGPLRCNADNVLNALRRASANSFCSTYTKPGNAGQPLPTYISAYSTAPSRISSGCTCLNTAAASKRALPVGAKFRI